MLLTFVTFRGVEIVIYDRDGLEKLMLIPQKVKNCVYDSTQIQKLFVFINCEKL